MLNSLSAFINKISKAMEPKESFKLRENKPTIWRPESHQTVPPQQFFAEPEEMVTVISPDGKETKVKFKDLKNLGK